MAGTLYRTFGRKSTHEFRFRVRNTRTMGWVDTSGWTFELTAKNLNTEADPGVFQLTSGAGHITAVAGLTGMHKCKIPSSATAGLTAGADTLLQVDVVGYDASLQPWKILDGTFFVQADTTHI